MPVRLPCAMIWMLAVLGGISSELHAQFSPGALSRAHMHLEGTQNCATCHEVGKEISGAKCLTCHVEIKAGLDARRGFHFTVSAERKCVACHKEHLGRDVQTTIFRRETFDHRQTGFELTGKHSTIQCEQCHTHNNIRSSQVLDIVAKSGRQTFLGLNAECVSCHEDRHRGTVGADCQTCHATASWLPAQGFDHAATSFPLVGKHAPVQCASCHAELRPANAGSPVLFTTNAFADCTPCHKSPHREQFAEQSCKSCHSPEGWSRIAGRAFDHDMTGFKLVGRHAILRCEQCHKTRGGGAPATYRMPHEKCTDCHEDYHRGEFAGTFANDCAQCHTEQGFRPSTFTHEWHSRSRFPLAGAHGATPCSSCHYDAARSSPRFSFTDVSCTACHTDRHGGQFNDVMSHQSCGTCHTTVAWKSVTFDHDQTNFPLAGKHAAATCEACHKPAPAAGVVQYRGTLRECQSCHQDNHRGQFAGVDGATDCARCHSTNGWQILVFDHNTQSKFALTGAHARVPCTLCHHEDESEEGRFIRFKPTPTDCQSCHTEGVRSDG
jgi:hypothetical protein